MTRAKTVFFILCASIVFLVTAIFIQRRIINELLLDKTNISLSQKYGYCLSRFMHSPISDNEIVFMDSLRNLDPYAINIYIPLNSCSSCIITLLLHLDEISADKSTIHFWLPENDYRWQDLIRTRGYSEFDSIQEDNSSNLQRILITRNASNGWQVYYTFYEQGMDCVLDYIIHDNTPN